MKLVASMLKSSSVLMGLFCMVLGMRVDAHMDLSSMDEKQVERILSASQNPLSNLLRLPFQNSTAFGSGPFDRNQNILNIQPVIPIGLTKNMNLIVRLIQPIVFQPFINQPKGGEFGLGEFNPSFYLTPISPKPVTWGIGPTFVFPTASHSSLGTDKWSAGPTGILVVNVDNWLFGALSSNFWSYAGSENRDDVNLFYLQPFVSLIVPKGKGLYLASSPIITANWNASSGQKWTIPLGGGPGLIFALNGIPLNASVQAFGFVEKPDFGPDWLLRLNFQVLFPKDRLQR